MGSQIGGEFNSLIGEARVRVGCCLPRLIWSGSLWCISIGRAASLLTLWFLVFPQVLYVLFQDIENYRVQGSFLSPVCIVTDSLKNVR